MIDNRANRQNVTVTVHHNQGGGQLSPVIHGVSFRVEEALKSLLGDTDGLVDLRLLENAHSPKLFVITRGDDIERDHTIVQRMIQVEDILPSTDLNYDIVPEEQAHFIPDDARSIL